MNRRWKITAISCGLAMAVVATPGIAQAANVSYRFGVVVGDGGGHRYRHFRRDPDRFYDGPRYRRFRGGYWRGHERRYRRHLRRHFRHYDRSVFGFTYRYSEPAYYEPPVVYPGAVYVEPPAVTLVRPAARVRARTETGAGVCRQQREYQTTLTVNGRQVDGFGTACLQPDGSWRLGPPRQAR